MLETSAFQNSIRRFIYPYQAIPYDTGKFIYRDICTNTKQSSDAHNFFFRFLKIGTYAGGGGVTTCHRGADGGNGGQQGTPAQGDCSPAESGRAGTADRGGEGGNVLLYSVMAVDLRRLKTVSVFLTLIL